MKSINTHKKYSSLPDHMTNITFCPVCKSKNIHFLKKIYYQDQNIKYDLCKNCLFIFMNPKPTEEWYKNIYRLEFWERKEELEDDGLKKQFTKQIKWAKKIISYINLIDKFKNRKLNILEVGASFGMISFYLKKNLDADVDIIEPSKRASNVATKVFDLNLLARTAEDFVHNNSTKKKYDLIIFSHSLENMLDPEFILKNMKSFLTKDGSIMIDTPNNMYRRSWHIYHPNCFSEPNLSILAKKAGFYFIKLFKNSNPKFIFGSLYLTVFLDKNNNKQSQSVSKITYLNYLSFSLGPLFKTLLTSDKLFGKLHHIISNLLYPRLNKKDKTLLNNALRKAHENI